MPEPSFFINSKFYQKFSPDVVYAGTVSIIWCKNWLTRKCKPCIIEERRMEIMKKWYQKPIAIAMAVACLFAGGNDWSCPGFSATTATDSRSRRQNLYWGIRWVAVGV